MARARRARHGRERPQRRSLPGRLSQARRYAGPRDRDQGRRCRQPDRRSVACPARPGPVPGLTPGGDRASVVGPLCRPPRGRDVPVRRLRGGPLRLVDEVRVRVGLAELLSSRRRPRRSNCAPIRATGWCARRSCAGRAAAIWATCSTTGLSPLASVTASTRCRWTSPRNDQCAGERAVRRRPRWGQDGRLVEALTVRGYAQDHSLAGDVFGRVELAVVLLA